MSDFHKCGKPDCMRKVSQASRYCCQSCSTAAEAPAPYEIEPYDAALHPILCHSKECDERSAERGECTVAGGLVRGGEELDELDDLERRFIAALGSPAQQARAMHRATMRLLPRRTRLRLRYSRQVDGAAIWLVCHGRHGAAEALWRLSGLWSAR